MPFVLFVKLRALYFVAFQATGAYICGFHFAVLDDFHFLHVRVERPFRLAVTVAHVVSCALALVAYAAYSRHIYHLRGCNRCIGRKKRSALNERYYYIKIDKKKQSILRAFA